MKRLHACKLTLLCGLMTTFCSPIRPEWVWWEGETPETSTNARSTRHQPESDFGRVLSGFGKLEAKDQTGEAMTALYRVEVPVSGVQHLWVRKFWKHGPFDWRFGEGEWQQGKWNVALHSGQFIMKNWGTNWVYLGEVTIEKGEVRFEIRSQDNKGFVDCFLLTSEPFQPAGRLKPDEKSGETDAGFFAWEPDADPFAESPLDLRYLNEEQAGMHGFVKREGERFIRGDGEELRFWMTQCENLFRMQPHMQQRHARRLAKSGVNLARVAMMGEFVSFRRNPEGFKQDLDRIHRGVAALKDEGIYMYFGHLFWDTHVKAFADDELPGLKKGEAATAALFFNEALQERYLDFVEALMKPVNPYTGLSLAEDPAVAFIEVQNESNTLFWTLNPDRLPVDTLDRIQMAFAEFAAEKHGSLEKALEFWGDIQPGDDLEGKRAGILSAWFMTADGKQGSPHRSTDQVEFLTRRQYRLYAKMKERFREMGIQSLVAGSNWKTADPSTLGPLEYYSYTAVDVVNKNEYFSPVSLHNPRTYLVEPGDVFAPLSAMRNPEITAVLMTAQPAGHPYMITENNWDKPNHYRVEWPFLVATYGAASGIDGWSFFAYDDPMWESDTSVWTINTPETIGQFPAYALMYRRGDVLEPRPVLEEDVPLQELYERTPIALPELQYKDELWKNTLGGDPKVEYKTDIDPKAFFTGPVRLHLAAEEPALRVADLDTLIDNDEKVIRHLNGQLEWAYGQGVVKVDTPTSQGVCGFLGGAGEPLSLTDVTFASENEYGALVAVSLDGKPIAESASLLIQAGTQDQPYGYRTEQAENGGLRVVEPGRYPLQVREIQASVRLKGWAGAQVTALDGNGYPVEAEVKSTASGENLEIQFPEDRLYLWIQR